MMRALRWLTSFDFSQPVPVELIVLNGFENSGQTRAVGFLKGIRGDRHEAASGGKDAPDSRTVFPFSYTIVGSGSAAGQYTLWADSEQSRQEWKEKFQLAQALRSAEIEANTVSSEITNITAGVSLRLLW